MNWIWKILLGRPLSSDDTQDTSTYTNEQPPLPADFEDLWQDVMAKHKKNLTVNRNKIVAMKQGISMMSVDMAAGLFPSEIAAARKSKVRCFISEEYGEIVAFKDWISDPPGGGFYINVIAYEKWAYPEEIRVINKSYRIPGLKSW